jgi:thymidylate kinase
MPSCLESARTPRIMHRSDCFVYRDRREMGREVTSLASRGFLLALSGIESSGKSTQRELLVDYLRSRDVEPVCIWSRPGYSSRLRVGKRLLRALRGRKPRERAPNAPGRYPRRAANLGHPLKRWSWLTLALLDLLWLHGVRLRLARASGRTLLCDRYLLDSLVDFRVYFPDDRVEERWLCRLWRALAVRPDAAFCLLVPAEESMRRTRERGRRHWETAAVLEQRLATYRALAEELDVRVLDGREAPERIAALLRAALAPTTPTAQQAGN